MPELISATGAVATRSRSAPQELAQATGAGESARHSMPLFSVIIPTYNRLDLLRQALESVWRQTFSDYELIVVDDGSTDGTREYLKAQGDRVTVAVQSNRGPGAARNLGASQARGEYLAFLDSDDLWFPWTLAHYEQVIRSSQRPAFIAGKPFVFDNHSQLEGQFAGELEMASFPDYLASGDEWRWYGVSSFVVRRQNFQTVGGFADEHINGEDADLALRLSVAPGFVQISAPYTFAYREHGISAMKVFQRTVDGVRYKLAREQAGHYPGGRARALERLRILTRHLRPVALDCLRRGQQREAWQLYWASFRWHLALGKFKFLIGFPARALSGMVRRGS